MIPPRPSPMMSSYARDAIKAALAYGDDAVLDRAWQLCVARKRTAMIFFPALMLGVALVMLPLALKENLLQNSQLAAGLWYGLVLTAIGSHFVGYGLSDGARNCPLSNERLRSVNWARLQQAPGARQVHDALLAAGIQVRWIHADLMDQVYEQERKAGLFVENGRVLHWTL